MIEIRIHGRGGQGAVVASLILARAAFREGYFVQSFPEFGVERRGAPVVAFLRLDRSPLYLRTKVYTPGHVVVLDPLLVGSPSVFEGLQSGGTVLINMDQGQSVPKALKEKAASNKWRIATVDATNVAASCGVGTPTAPVVNTAMSGAFSKIGGLFGVSAVLETISEMLPDAAEKNRMAAQKAFDSVRFLNRQ